MIEVKLTKGGLRSQQVKLAQLERYLPTLQLKKSMLQAEVFSTKMNIEELLKELEKEKKEVERFSPLLSQVTDCDILYYAKVEHVEKHYENIAGVEIPIFENTIFPKMDYFLFDTPAWVDYSIIKIKKMVDIKEKVNVEEEKKRALEKELREVSIRVNLFEKILIPRTIKNIKKIKIFLGDQQLAAVSQAKVAKRKIEEKENDYNS